MVTGAAAAAALEGRGIAVLFPGNQRSLDCPLSSLQPRGLPSPDHVKRALKFSASSPNKDANASPGDGKAATTPARAKTSRAAAPPRPLAPQMSLFDSRAYGTCCSTPGRSGGRRIVSSPSKS